MTNDEDFDIDIDDDDIMYHEEEDDEGKKREKRTRVDKIVDKIHDEEMAKLTKDLKKAFIGRKYK
jgi:hypothetical protein